MSGPLRKPDDQRARRNKDVIPLKVVYRTPTAQPELPTSVNWHMQVVLAWHIWGQSEMSDEFTDLEWQYLTDTMLILNEFWNGDMKVASELRLRAAKFGVTPEDRARLRIQVVTAQLADETLENGGKPPAGGARDRYQSPPQAG